MLSGGGARGLAHAGALAALEERGWDPSIVTGTSMGAIIGGLYAAGYSSEFIVALVESMDWREAFAPVPQPVGPRQEWRHPLLSLASGRPPFLLPGLVDSHRIDRSLIHMLFDAGARAENDFDRLPRRFRAVAADFEDGAEVPLGSGDLPRAVRASIAVPGAFSAIPWNGRALVDGGLADNLPVSVARDMGARVVAAVDVLRPRDPPEGHPLDLMVRALRLTLLNALPEGPPPDVLVLPELESGFNEVSFPRYGAPLARLGYDAALEAPPPSLRDEGARAPASAPDSIHAIEIETPDPRLRPLTLRALRHLASAPYDTAALFRAVDRIFAAGPVRAVWPRIERRDGRNILVALVLPEPDFRIASNAGWNMDEGARGWIEMHKRMPGSWAPEFAIGVSADRIDRSASTALRFHPPALTPLALVFGAGATRTDIRLFDENDVVGEVRAERVGGWIGAEWLRLDPDAGAVVAFRVDHVSAEQIIFPFPFLAEVAVEGWSYGPMLRISGIGPAARTLGTPPLIELELRRGDVSYERVRLAGSLPFALGPLRAAVVADAGLSSRRTPIDARFDLGGPDGLPGMREQRELASVRVLGGIDLGWPIPFDGDLRVRLRAGTAARNIDDLGSASWIGAAGIGPVWWTVIGPIAFEYGRTDQGEDRIAISIGYQF